MSKDDAINTMNCSNLVDKSGVLSKKYIFFLLYIKMSENTNLTYYQKNRDVIINRAKDYYKNDKERLKEQERINTKTYLKKKKRIWKELIS